MSSRYIDISMAIRNGMLVWPTDPPIEITNFKSPTKGDRSTVSKFTMGTHTGTHIDAICHYSLGGRLHGGGEVSRLQDWTGGIVSLIVATPS